MAAVSFDVLSKAMGAVVAERSRQEKLKAEGRFAVSCADRGEGELSHAERLTVRVEEVGEVAREVLAYAARVPAPLDVTETIEALRGEVVQVAAVALAWIQALDAELAESDEVPPF